MHKMFCITRNRVPHRWRQTPFCGCLFPSVRDPVSSALNILIIMLNQFPLLCKFPEPLITLITQNILNRHRIPLRNLLPDPHRYQESPEKHLFLVQLPCDLPPLRSQIYHPVLFSYNISHFFQSVQCHRHCRSGNSKIIPDRTDPCTPLFLLQSVKQPPGSCILLPVIASFWPHSFPARRHICLSISCAYSWQITGHHLRKFCRSPSHIPHLPHSLWILCGIPEQPFSSWPILSMILR